MKFLLIITAIILPFFLIAQNCSVNAGLEGKWCAGDKILLDGAMAGTIASGHTPIWSLVFGPGSVTFDDSTKLKTYAVAQVAGEYIFRLTVQCSYGTASQEVKHIVSGGAQPDAGEDITVHCLDSEFSTVLTGSTPPPGFTAYWTVPNGTVQNNVYRPSFDDFDKCPNSVTSYILQYNMKDQNNCLYNDTKAINFLEYVPPLRLSSGGGCGYPFKLAATCTGAGLGTWSFISPVDGGGASFDSPNQRVTGIVNGDPSIAYVVRFSFTGSCHDQSDTLEFTIPEDTEDASQADFENIYKLSDNVTKEVAGKTITYTAQFCGIPDSLLVLAKLDNLKEEEKAFWSISKMGCSIWYGEIKSDPLINASAKSSALLDNLEYGTYTLTYKVVNKVGCETTANVIININHQVKNTSYFLSNSCENEDFNKYNYYDEPHHNFKIYDNNYVHFLLPFDNYTIENSIHPLLAQNGNPGYLPSQSPLGGDQIKADFNVVYNLTKHKFEYYLNIPTTAPSGQYIFQIPYTYSCGNYATLVVDFSKPPERVNAGSDLYFCGDAGALVGNDRLAPEWILISKKPEGIPDPVMEGTNTRYPTLSNLTPQSEYLFGYVSRGGTNCPDKIDTVKVGVADVPPPQPDAGQDITTCAYSSLVLNATPGIIPYGSYGFWEMVSQSPAGMPPSIEKISQPVTRVFNLQPNTVYTFRFTLENKCGKNSDEVTITINETVGPPPAFAGADRCLPPDSTYFTLNANKISPPFLGHWTGHPNNPSGYIFSYADRSETNVTGLTTGTYGFVWTIEGTGCSPTSDTVWITIGTPAQVETAEITLCNQEIPATATLKALPAAGGKWSMLSNKPGVITNPENAVTTVTGLEAGIYMFRWTAGSDLCSGYADVKVTIGKATPIPDAGENITICKNSDGTITLNAYLPEGAIGYWTMINVDNITPSAGFSYVSGDQFDPHATIKVKPGLTRLKWTILVNDLCSQDPPFDDILITYFAESIDECCPSACIKPFINPVCNHTNNTISLNELLCTETAPGFWTLTSGPGVADTLALGDTLSFFNQPPGDYIITYTLIDTLEGCPSSSSDTIKVLAQPEAPTIVADSICPNEPYLLPSGIIVTNPGIYYDTLQSYSGCDSVVTTNLSFITDTLYHKHLIIEVDPEGKLPIGSKAVLTINNPEPGKEYSWYKNNELLGIYGPSIEILIDDGSYIYSAEMVSFSDNYCSAEGRIQIKGITPTIRIPNAFTPNNDNRNDRFRAVIDPGIEIVEMVIVSRWGEVMYSDSGNEGWDGRYKNQEAPADTYLFRIRYKFIVSGDVKEEKGEVNLFR
jgi:gliding motility-associated-like protein